MIDEFTKAWDGAVVADGRSAGSRRSPEPVIALSARGLGDLRRERVLRQHRALFFRYMLPNRVRFAAGRSLRRPRVGRQLACPDTAFRLIACLARRTFFDSHWPLGHLSRRPGRLCSIAFRRSIPPASIFFSGTTTLASHYLAGRLPDKHRPPPSATISAAVIAAPPVKPSRPPPIEAVPVVPVVPVPMVAIPMMARPRNPIQVVPVAAVRSRCSRRCTLPRRPQTGGQFGVTEAAYRGPGDGLRPRIVAPVNTEQLVDGGRHLQSRWLLRHAAPAGNGCWPRTASARS